MTFFSFLHRKPGESSELTRKRNSLRYKLFQYMFLLAVLLMAAFLIGLSVIVTALRQRNTFRSSLQMQMTVFSQDISSEFETLEATGFQMSLSVTEQIRNYLNGRHISFSEINDSETDLKALQECLFDTIRDKLLQTDSSGAFLLLDATVNTSLTGADCSRSGLYIRKSSPDSDSELLLYRGITEIGKKNNVMPHRKWTLEFHTQNLPGYDTWKSSAQPDTCSFSDIFVLPGTSDKVLLLLFPLFSPDGTFIGVCGFEVNDSFFRQKIAQPTTLSHLTCILADIHNAPEGQNSGTLKIDPANSMSCGTTDGYYLAPAGTLTVTKKLSEKQVLCTDRVTSYLGITEKVKLAGLNEWFRAYILIPLRDYQQMVFREAAEVLLIFAVLLCLSLLCCRYFSRRFLNPILKNLDQLKNREQTDTAEMIPEIAELFTLFSEIENDRKAETSALENEIENARKELSRVNREYDDAKRELSRLVYARKKEVDPESYQLFLNGLNTLTRTEKKIFLLYLSGKGTKEIMEENNIKESTLRYHNRNIYSKLGINSMKQLLRYAAIMNGDNSD